MGTPPIPTILPRWDPVGKLAKANRGRPLSCRAGWTAWRASTCHLRRAQGCERAWPMSTLTWRTRPGPWDVLIRFVPVTGHGPNQGNQKVTTGLLKRYILQPFETLLFQHQNKGNPPFTRQCSGVQCKDPWTRSALALGK